MIALDISATAVKLLELGRAGRRLSVESCAIAPLPPDAVIERRIVNIQAVGRSIRRAVRHCGSRARDAILAIPESAVIHTVLSVPSVTDDAELESQVELAAARRLPLPIDRAHFDFKVLGPSRSQPAQLDVLLVAAPSAAVAARAAACESGGLNPHVMDTEPYALEHAATLLTAELPAGGRGKTIAIIDTGATQTLLTVLHDMETIYTHSQPFGGAQLTHAVMRCFGLDFEQAERYKRQGGVPARGHADILPALRNRLAQRLHRALQTFLASPDSQPLDQVALAGGGANITGIAPQLQSQIGVPVQRADPLRSLSAGRRVNRRALTPYGPAMMLACGLALRRFD